MESITDQKIINASVDDNQLENGECTSIICENQHEKEMFDANSSSDDDDNVDDDSDSDSDDDSMDFDDVFRDVDDLPTNHKISYKILSQAEVRKRQEHDITNVSNVLSIARAEAIVLLVHCKWDVKLVTERWDEDSMGFREQLGLFEKIAGNEFETSMTCKKCSGTVLGYLDFIAFCGHEFCITCWQDFIGTSLKERHLLLRCPDKSCNAAVNQDLITMVASESDQKIYSDIFLKSYLSEFSKGKWCPNGSCNHGVLLDSSDYISSFTCKCLFSFCYKCSKEAHQPVSCATANNWGLESFKLSQNWKILDLINCPKCDRSLDIRSWNMRMECSSCNFHFCWRCYGSFFGNGSWQGDQYVHICIEEKLKEVSEVENNRDNSRNAMHRYQDYLARWNSLHNEQHQVLMNLQTMQHDELKVLAEKQGLPLEEVSFVKDAWLQAAECNRVFKWASVYDYYDLAFEENRKCLYNTLLDHGTFVLEELCKVAGDLNQFIGTNPPIVQFEDFRERLSFKSSVARNYFRSMEIAIHSGCPDMETLRCEIRSRQAIESNPEINVETTSGQTTEFAVEASNWTCPRCNLSNYGSTTICFMCYH